MVIVIKSIVYYLETNKYIYGLKKKMINFMILPSIYIVKKSHCLCLGNKKLLLSMLIILKSRNYSLLKEEKINFLSQKIAGLHYSIIIVYYQKISQAKFR